MKFQLRSLFRTATFRLALAQAAMFTLFAFALLLTVYFTTAGQLTRDAERAADTEFAALAQIYNEGGRQRLNEEIIDRIGAGGAGLYAFADPNGEVISGSFDTLPVQPDVEPRRVVFPFDAVTENGKVRKSARGRVGRLLNGPILLVARDMGDANAIVGRISSAVSTGAVVGLVFSLVAGYAAARQAARRADLLSKTARDVMAGDLSRRAPVAGIGDEFDDLAQDLNAMLERIQRLVISTRTAGDAIAHDLRSPLVRMRQTMEQALDQPPDAQADREALRKAMEETEHILDTFSALLNLSRAQSFEHLKLQSVDVSGLAGDLAEFFAPAAEDAGLAFEAVIAPGVAVEGEPRLIMQAVANLIENAVKYTPSGGAIRFEVRRPRDGGAEVLVADSGPGVPPHERERVKERFVRLDPERAHGGAGLGLAMVTVVAEVHRGQFVLDDGLGGPHGPGLSAKIALPAAPRQRARST
ncbi:MAG: HAMP domain-containing histidine kinase [Alphaproteobacteria bacterium]|nr:HAMP domain-containing histidine kinase [Alphaproteobacteria bacterium]